MKQILQKYTAALAVILICTTATNAQTWQWGKRGGSSTSTSNGYHDKIVNMATDKNGNVYVLGSISSAGSANVDGNALARYGETDIILSSFSCNGTYRWSKVIGGAGDEFGGSIGVDTIGHVFVAGQVFPAGVHYSADSTQASSSVKSIFLIQYDTSGTFRWLRQPNPDTATLSSTFSNSTSMDMVVTGNGDVYWYALLSPGPVAGGNGWVVTNKREGHILKYNAAGVLIDHILPQMDISKAGFSYFHFSRSSSGKFIFAGTRDFYPGSGLVTSFTIGGQPMDHNMFIAAFSPTGQFLWKRENVMADASARLYGSPAIDGAENIYVSGSAQPGDTLNGFVFTNVLFPFAVNLPFISKLSITGANLWTKSASANANDIANNVVLKGANEVWLSGTAGSVWWDTNYKIQGQLNGGYFIYSTRFSSTGAVLGMDSLKGGFGGQNWALTSASDRNGNLYVGGEFDGTLNVAGQTLIKLGGASDFFVAKLGNANCNCTAPTAAFTKAINARTVTLTYNGTTTNVDSVVWNYGNGTTAKKTGAAMSTAFAYIYPANGTYNVCATAYGSCGSNQSCQSITVSNVGISGIALDGIHVYPNPANDYVVIEGAAPGTTATILNLMGQQVMAAMAITGMQTLSLQSLSSGTYLLVLTDAAGARGTVRIVKQ